jgi:hypothetical protein
MARRKGAEYWDRVVESGRKHVDQDDRQQINDWLQGWGSIFCGVVLIGFIITVILMTVF